MLPDVVDHLLDTDGLELFGLCGAFVEYLRVQVVVVISDVLLSFSQEHHNVDPLFDLLRWEVRPQHIDVELVLDQHSDMLVGPVVVRPEGIHLVEDLTEVVSQFTFNTDFLFE